jgi:vacuolar-type H+-ATPase subunit H
VDIEFLVQRLEQYLFEECPKVFGNRLVNEEIARSQIVQIRDAIPDEIRRAREVLRQREAVLEQAKQEAEQVVTKAREDVDHIVIDHRVVKDARQQARSILQRAERDAATLRSDADEYVFDALSQLQEELTRILRVVENGLQRLETDREQALTQKFVQRDKEDED